MFAPASPIYKVPQSNPPQSQEPTIETQEDSEEAISSDDAEETGAAGEAAEETGAAEEGAEEMGAEGEEPAAEGEVAAGSTTVNDIVNELLKDFTKLIMVVVGFYFGGRSAEEVAKTLKGGETGT